MTFCTWLDAVEARALNTLGVGLDDVGDWPSYDTYDSGASVQEGFEAWADYHIGSIPTDLLDLVFAGGKS